MPVPLGLVHEFSLARRERPDVVASDADNWTDGTFHEQVVNALEKAHFDCLMQEDSLVVPDLYEGSMEIDLND